MEKKHFQKMGILFGTVLLTALPITMVATSCSNTTTNDDKEKSNSSVYDLPEHKDPKAQVSPDQHGTFKGDSSTIIKSIKDTLNSMTKANFLNDIKYFINGIASANPNDKKFTTATIKNFTVDKGNTLLPKATFTINYAQKNTSDKREFIKGHEILKDETISTTLVANSTAIVPMLINNGDTQFASYAFQNVKKTTIYPNGGEPQTETTNEKNYMINNSKSYFMNKSYKGYSLKSNYVNIGDQTEVQDFIKSIDSKDIDKGMNAFLTSIDTQATTYVNPLNDMLDYLSWYLNGRDGDQQGNLNFLGVVLPSIKSFIPTIEKLLSKTSVTDLIAMISKLGIEITDVEKDAIIQDINLITPFITDLAKSVSNFDDMVTTTTTVIAAPVIKNGKVTFDYQQTYTMKKDIIINIKGTNGLLPIFRDLNIEDLKPLIDQLSPGLTDQITQIQGLLKKKLIYNVVARKIPDTLGLFKANGDKKADQVSIDFKANNSKIEPSYGNDLKSLGFKLSDVNIGFTYVADQMLANLDKYKEFHKAFEDVLTSSEAFTQADKLNITLDMNGLSKTKHSDYDMSSYSSKIYLKNRQVSWNKDAAKNLLNKEASPYNITKADILNELNFEKGKSIDQENGMTISNVPLGIDLSVSVMVKVGVKSYNNFITVNFAKPVTYFDGTNYSNTNSISLNVQSTTGGIL